MSAWTLGSSVTAGAVVLSDAFAASVIFVSCSSVLDILASMKELGGSKQDRKG